MDKVVCNCLRVHSFMHRQLMRDQPSRGNIALYNFLRSIVDNWGQNLRTAETSIRVISRYHRLSTEQSLGTLPASIEPHSSTTIVVFYTCLDFKCQTENWVSFKIQRAIQNLSVLGKVVEIFLFW